VVEGWVPETLQAPESCRHLTFRRLAEQDVAGCGALLTKVVSS
jgi:hypothetical protein